MGILDAPPFISKPRLYQPSHLRRWQAKRAGALTGLAYLSCVGDSITAGAYASTAHDSSNTSKNQWRDWGWAGQLRALLSRDYGYAGLGTSFFVGDEPAYSTAGAPTASSTIGPMQTGYRLASGDSITILTAKATQIDIIGWFTTGAQPFTYTVDGGASVTAANGSVNDSFYREQITGLADTTHTIVISGPASNFAYISQWFARSASTGIIVSRVGKSGSTSDTLAFATAGVVGTQANQTRMHKAMFARPGSVSDLAIIGLGYNDAALQGTNGITPTIYRANLKAATDFVTAQGGCTLLISEPRSSGGTTPFTEAQFYAQALDIANTDDHVAFLDIAEAYGTTFAAANAMGYQYASGLDPIHPTAGGHAALAEIIYRAITLPGIVNV